MCAAERIGLPGRILRASLSFLLCRCGCCADELLSIGPHPIDQWLSFPPRTRPIPSRGICSDESNDIPRSLLHCIFFILSSIDLMNYLISFYPCARSLWLSFTQMHTRFSIYNSIHKTADTLLINKAQRFPLAGTKVFFTNRTRYKKKYCRFSGPWTKNPRIQLYEKRRSSRERRFLDRTIAD